MEFRVLGPLEAVEGGRTVELGGPKQRALLALLLLSANRVVSSERLIDDLWDDDPPSTAGASLHVYVSRLRKAVGADRVATRAGGYALRLEPDELDLDRFEALAREGREALADGEAESAARTLRAALLLWRGPPLAGVAGQRWAQPDVARLQDARLAVEEDRIEADLVTGRHAEVVGELEAFVERHPLRERARMQLMLALYRCGRQAEALAEYGRARHALVEGLGIEPSPPLQLLERRILNQDPELEASAGAPAPAAQEPEAPLGRKLVSVVFADLGVSMQTTRDPERLGAFVAEVRETAASELVRAGGTVEVGVADAVLAVFGSPSAQEDHAVRAAHGALAVLEALDARFGATVAPRVGVETGEVVVAAHGHAVGEPVMTAGALLRRARPGEALAGPRAAASARTAFALRPTPHGFLLVGRREAAVERERPRTFVNRTTELAALEAALERVGETGAASIVSVVGEAGIGKTALVAELRHRARVDATWLVGRCRALGGTTAYEPLAGALRELAGLDAAGTAENVRGRLGDRVALAPFVGVDAALGVHPREARDRLEEAWLELVGEAAAGSPLALVVEDVHWAEQPLLDLLGRTARAAVGSLLLVLTERPEPGGGTEESTRDATRIELEPLTAADSALLAESLDAPLSEPRRAELVERSGGNPLFLEELVLAHGDDQPATGQPRIPDTVQSVLAARIDRLPATARQTLGAAAVIGRSFAEEAVTALCGRKVALRELEESDFTRVVASATVRRGRVLAFKHALTQEVAYASLPVRRRAHLHAAYADWLEHSPSGEPDASDLAFHLAASVRPEDADLAWADAPERAAELRERAVIWLATASEHALGAFDLAGARRLVEEALRLQPGPAGRTALLRLRARAHELAYEMDDFRTALEEALESAPTAELQAEIAAELARAGAAPYMWRSPPTEETVDAWIERALGAEGGPRATRARALQARAMRAPLSGATDAAESRQLAELLGEPRLLIGAYEAEGRVALAARRYEDAWRWSGRALAVARELDDPDRLSGAQLNAIVAFVHAGRLDAARELAREHAAVAGRLSAHHRVHAVGFTLVVETIAGRWAEARDLTATAESAATANEDTPCQFNWRSLGLTALAAAQLGDGHAARTLAERAVEMGRRRGSEPCDSGLLRLATESGDRDRLAALLERTPPPGPWDPDLLPARLDALTLLGERRRVELEGEPLVGSGGYDEPFALRALARVRGDDGLLREAVDRFSALGLGWRAEETARGLRAAR